MGGGEAGSTVPLSPLSLSVQCLKHEKQDLEMAPLWSSVVTSGCQGTKSLLTQETTQWDKLIFFLKNSEQENICLQCVSCSVSFHPDEKESFMMTSKEMTYIVEKTEKFWQLICQRFCLNHKRIFDRNQRVLQLLYYFF